MRRAHARLLFRTSLDELLRVLYQGVPKFNTKFVLDSEPIGRTVALPFMLITENQCPVNQLMTAVSAFNHTGSVWSATNHELAYHRCTRAYP